MTGLRTPATSVFGDYESVPAISIRDADLALVLDVAAAADQVVTAPVPAGALAVEISVENGGAEAAVVEMLATTPPTAADAAALARALRRRVPAGAQLVETRAVLAGDVLVFRASAAVRIVVHAHKGV